MTSIFIIEDERHAVWQKGEFETFEHAMVELKKRAILPWNKEPNRCPCTDWKTCERNYQIVEFNNSIKPWKEIDRRDVLTISADAIKWQNVYSAKKN